MSQPYLSLEAELHDAFWDAEDDASEVALMAEFLRQHPGPALEMGAGSGRLMFPLLQMGFDVQGVELSEDMLQIAKARSQALGLHAQIHLGDMATWQSVRKFAALLAPAFTLQLADDPATVLDHWFQLLEPSGGLYLTTFMPYAELLGDLPENEWYDDHRVTLPDGRTGLLETRHRLDQQQQIVERDHRYSLSGNPPQHHESHQSIRWFEHAQLVALLENHGFRVERFFLDFEPDWQVPDPDLVDFGGIITYHAVKNDGCSP
ncbi:MAG: class I SAM-dependent methyltransferase [Akkermansiaceae bacterium]|nr:class I SAM-dependent methyltransferase [Akkermansiaceae bacterium]